MVAIQTAGDIGAFGRNLADRLNTLSLDGSYSIQIEKADSKTLGKLAEAGHLPLDTTGYHVLIKKPVTAEATLHFVKVISEEFCRWTIEKEHMTEKRRALVITEEGAERKLRTILFEDVGA